LAINSSVSGGAPAAFGGRRRDIHPPSAHSCRIGSAVWIWNNATRSVGQLAWLTGLGPPRVFEHAGGPPRCSRMEDAHLLRRTKVRDAHRVLVGASIELGWRRKRIRWLDLVRRRETRARAYEERCETNFIDYTLVRERQQDPRPIVTVASVFGSCGAFHQKTVRRCGAS
jgi:hypothetical protein